MRRGQRELQAEGYTAVEDSVLRLLRELMHDRLTPEPTPSQWDRVIELLCDEKFYIRRLLRVHQSLCEQRTASPYFERASVLELQTRNSILLTLPDRIKPVFSQKKSLILAQKE